MINDFSLLLALLPVLSFAQPIKSWPTKDSFWDIYNFDYFDYQTRYGRIWHLDGDTVLQDKTYQKVSRFYILGNPEYYPAGVRSDSLGTVYVLPKDSTTEYVLYDFSAQIGDTVSNVLTGYFVNPSYITNLVVLDKDTIQMSDGPHIKMEVAESWSYFSVFIYDGIDCRQDFLFQIYFDDMTAGYECLSCMSNDGLIILGANCLLSAREEKSRSACSISYPIPDRSGRVCH